MYCQLIFVAAFTEPNKNFCRMYVDVTHDCDLCAPLCQIILINAAKVNPNLPFLLRVSQSSNSCLQVEIGL
jgi:hypothetical protein